MTTRSSPVATSETFRHSGEDRLVRRLDPGDAARRRIVVSLHGSGFTSTAHDAMIDAGLLCRGDALVITPEALLPFRFSEVLPQGLAWNVPGSPLPGMGAVDDGPDDLGFLVALLQSARARHPSLPIHLLGYSGGARMACHVLGADKTVTSAGLVGGALFPAAAASSVAAVLAIHGLRDDVNPYDGGDDARWTVGVRTSMQSWADRFGGGGAHRLRELAAGVVEERFGRTVGLVSLDAVGHAWPGTRDPSCLAEFGPAGTWSATAHLSAYFADFE